MEREKRREEKRKGGRQTELIFNNLTLIIKRLNKINKINKSIKTCGAEDSELDS